MKILIINHFAGIPKYADFSLRHYYFAKYFKEQHRPRYYNNDVMHSILNTIVLYEDKNLHNNIFKTVIILSFISLLFDNCNSLIFGILIFGGLTEFRVR